MRPKPLKAAYGTGVCALGYKMILDGKTNAQVLAAIQKKFPTSRLKIGGVGWMRNKLRKDGKSVKRNSELTGNRSTKKAA